MGSDAEAQAAIAAMSGVEQDGRALTVNEAKPREERPRSGGAAAADIAAGAAAVAVMAAETHRAAAVGMSNVGTRAAGPRVAASAMGTAVAIE